MKTLISWLAYNNDFHREGEKGRLKGVNKEGPNYSMHKYFWSYDRHILLYSGIGDETGAEMFKNEIIREFPEHKIEIVNANIKDPINLAEIKPVVEARLLDIEGDEIDIFASPGTPTMQVAWYICHTTLKLKTRILQMRPPDKAKTGKRELIEMKIEQSPTPVTAVIKEKRLAERGMKENYLITNSLKPVYDLAEKIAQNDRTTVLIYGETGTGKEHLARYIHSNSPRKDKEFVTVNCSAFSDQLLESRLFGYKKGAFTGAEKDTKGLFQMADKGTIFLDEIGDISPYMQQALLRVIQEKEVHPLGGRSEKVDVRIIAATNRNLTEMCKEGRFRWDLYYRLSVVELTLPSLAERPHEDLEMMIDFFLESKRKELMKSNPLVLNRDTMTLLEKYPWPGNIRELENLIESLYVCCEGEIKPEHLPERFRKPQKTGSLSWKDAEKAHIEYVLKLKKGNQRQAWQALGYGSINTFKSKLREYGINPADFTR